MLFSCGCSETEFNNFLRFDDKFMNKYQYINITFLQNLILIPSLSEFDYT